METLLVISTLAIIYSIIMVIELISLHRFNLRIFELGFTVYRIRENTDLIKWKNYDGIIEKPKANYVLLSDYNLGFFVSKFKFIQSNSWVLNSFGFPLTLYGKFQIIDNQLEITGKVSFRLIILICLPFLYFLLMPLIYYKAALIIPAFLFIGIELAILYILYIFQKSKLMVILEEIKEIC